MPDEERLNRNIRDAAWKLLEEIFCENEGCACDELCKTCTAAFQLQMALQDFEKWSGKPDGGT